MLKKSLFIVIFAIMVVPLTGCFACIPPFFDGGITATDYFNDKVTYSTFKIDAGAENGFTESESGEFSLKELTDGNEKNVLLQSYRCLIFTTKEEGVTLTSFAFIVQSEEDCFISFSFFYGEESIASDRVFLEKNKINTVCCSDINISLKKDEELKIIILNPLEIGKVAFRTDSYIFIGQEV